MRGYPIGRRISNTKPSFSSTFSTSSGGGGRGRGRGISGDFVRAPASSDAPNPEPPQQQQQKRIGHGRGTPILPSFESFISSIGRGRPTTEPVPPSKIQFTPSRTPTLPSSIQSALHGAGRGKPENPVSPPPAQQEKEENRHIRSRSSSKPPAKTEETRPKISRDEAVTRALSILSQGGPDGMGRGRGGGRGRGRGRGRMDDLEEGAGSGLFLGDNADGEKLAQKLGLENMNKLVEGFEEMSARILPSPMDDAYLDAYHTNCMIEFEPEYLMGQFDQNPDIDEKPPMPLRDMLEKVKPFIMAYEGIESHEQWEEVVEETMKRVPLLKEIVDHYSGPDRVTGKKQREELERVAKAIPASAPASVKRFADRAVLSLQSNAGWGFDKKCQLMDKLVREVNQCYK